MTVTDEHVAILRTVLVGDIAEAQHRFDNLDPVVDRIGFTNLVSAGFDLASERRFHGGGELRDVLMFVADVRSRTPHIDDIDTYMAECLLLSSVLCDDTEDFPVDDAVGTELMLLAALVADAKYDDTALDAFLAEVRNLAQDWSS